MYVNFISYIFLNSPFWLFLLLIIQSLPGILSHTQIEVSCLSLPVVIPLFALTYTSMTRRNSGIPVVVTFVFSLSSIVADIRIILSFNLHFPRITLSILFWITLFSVCLLWTWIIRSYFVSQNAKKGFFN